MGPAVGESPQAAQAPEMHVGIWQDGDSVCSDPSRDSPQGPCTSPQPTDVPVQELISGQTFPLAERLKPLLTQLGSRLDKSPCTHLKSTRSLFLQQEPVSVFRVLWWVQVQPRGQGSPCPALLCPGSRNLRHHCVGPGEGEPPPGYNDCLFC